MGKFALSAVGMLAVLLAISSQAVAKPKLATKLPSHVKKVNVTVVKGKVKPAVLKNSKKQKLKPMVAAAPLIDVEKLGLSQFDDKYISKTVHFAASTAPLSEEYNCDAAAEELQLRKVEREAMAKCEGTGEQNCRLHQSTIVKKGELRCQDIPGRDCGQKKFYRGCVAQAIVVGGEEPEATASVF